MPCEWKDILWVEGSLLPYGTPNRLGRSPLSPWRIPNILRKPSLALGDANHRAGPPTALRDPCHVRIVCHLITYHLMMISILQHHQFISAVNIMIRSGGPPNTKHVILNIMWLFCGKPTCDNTAYCLVLIFNIILHIVWCWCSISPGHIFQGYYDKTCDSGNAKSNRFFNSILMLSKNSRK